MEHDQRGVRVELSGRNMLVQGVHLAGADTDMKAGIDGPTSIRHR
jgi:hypothetical protein